MLKHSGLILLWILISGYLMGQNVTFRVDMQNQNVTGAVRLTGGFAGWYDGKLEMSDADNDQVYELTLPLLPGRYEYKFLNNNWSGAEALASPTAKFCTISSNGNVNRILQMGQNDTILPVVCFDSCMACGSFSPPANVDVTFQVDMTALGTGATYITGNSLDNWCGNCIQMSDANNDNIYEVTRSMEPGFHEFKYTRNGWSNGEQFNPGNACTVTNFNFTNRGIYVPMGANAIVLPPAPFNACAPHAVNVFLEVDMGNTVLDPAGVFVAGNFNNWSANATPLDNLGHGIWGKNIVMIAGEVLEYNFLNGSATEALSSSCANSNGHRNMTVPDESQRMAATCFAQCGPCQDNLNLVWADEFNGSAIDTSKWNFDIGNGAFGWGNNELEFYTPNPTNARLVNGNLEITALRETIGNFNYTSARLQSRGKADFTYGRIEASIKAPKGQGIWPAFWLLSTDEVYGGWPSSGEIDIMELVGNDPDRIHGTVHYGPAPGAGHFSDGSSYVLPGVENYADGFHTYAVEWEPNEIRWYMDSVLYHSVSPWEIAPCDWPFDQDMHIILNVAVGGYWPGNPNSSTVFPQTMTVEYVRVYGTGPVAAPSPAAEAFASIYPNPSAGLYRIDLGQTPNRPYTISVFDLQGRRILSQDSRTAVTDIDLSNQEAGVYVLHLQTAQSNQVQKLIKTN